MQLRSYHGSDPIKAIQYYWPNISDDDAKSAAAGLEAQDWSAVPNFDREYRRAAWLIKRLGPMKEMG